MSRSKKLYLTGWDLELAQEMVTTCQHAVREALGPVRDMVAEGDRLKVTPPPPPPLGPTEETKESFFSPERKHLGRIAQEERTWVGLESL